MRSLSTTFDYVRRGVPNAKSAGITQGALASFAIGYRRKAVVPDEILKLSEAATLLKVAERTVYTMAQRSAIPAFEVHGHRQQRHCRQQ
ncbi:helix-turn-helix domain-containing protein [Rhodoblastus acidophilus]|nr:helix-turn-helix domain-containing protein [Rhodoblastus acidophilus]